MMLGSYNVNIPENFKLLYDVKYNILILFDNISTESM